MKQARSALTVLTVASALLAGCDRGPTSGAGFSLPPGDAVEGSEVFIRYQCADCHAVPGMENLRAAFEPAMNLPLGGETTRIQTYGELVTSIINPSHVISKKFPGVEVGTEGRSKMRNHNYVMTVNELIDLVAFLQSKYSLMPFVPTMYPPYVYPPYI
ncbi:MAG: cytochrome C [Alphaproteobacteria bacterium]|nr:cytochrome C [Alphaproteobacteria bacterium]